MKNNQPPASYFTLCQANPARFRKLYTQSYCVLHVLGGAKHIYRQDGSQLTVKTGDLVLFRAGESITFENQPAGTNDPYRAEGIAYRPDFVEAFQEQSNISRSAENSDHRRLPCSGDISKTYRQAVDALLTPDLPAAIAEHRLTEVLIWLTQAGIPLFLRHKPSFAERVRLTLLTDLEHRWRAREIAERLAVSEATLRRKLSAEETSFSDILQDARLSHALDLLMTSDKPITEIALTAGYGTPSAFSRSFRDRFNLTPREIRVPRETFSSTENDRIGTETDRDGKAA
ncbi:AraC family transcriptional regulator [Aestuariispira insulae]|nr:AraC family transcriptional regulator [Aestuariispira insulae]